MFDSLTVVLCVVVAFAFGALAGVRYATRRPNVELRCFHVYDTTTTRTGNRVEQLTKCRLCGDGRRVVCLAPPQGASSN
jgi:hypothetical protein